MSLVLKRFGRGYVRQAPSPLIELSADTLNVVSGQSTTFDITLTLTRTNFRRAVDLAVTGLPSGVTGAFSADPLDKDTPTSVLTLTFAAGATLGSSTFTITASGSGVSDAVLTPAITVANPGAVITIPTSAITVLQDSTKDFTVLLERIGAFSGTVTIAITGMPTGVTAAYPDGQTYTGATTSRRIRLTAASDAPLITDDAWTVTATGTGIDDWPVGGTVTVVDAVLPFFSDNFDSGSRTDANGFTWNSTGANVFVDDAEFYSGTHSLAFQYTGKVPGLDATAEQRYNMGRNLSELWVEYRMRVPDNFAHRGDNPANNKFHWFWQDSYSGGSMTLGVEYERAGEDTNSARMLSVSKSLEDGDGNIRGGDAVQSGPLFDVATRGTWRLVRIHIRCDTSVDNPDGVFEGWIDGTLMWRGRSDWMIWPRNGGTSSFFRYGYFMGWANSGFTDDTVFHVDDVKFYDVDPEWGY